MKTVKFIASLLTVLLFCTALTACAEENKEQPKQDAVQNVELAEKEKVQRPEGDDGGQNAREEEAREQENATRPEDEGIVFPGEGDDGGQNAREQEAREQEERRRQEEEQRQQEEQERQEQQAGGYEHQIGDAVFYTEHDLGKYVFADPNNPGFYRIDIRAMLQDIWSENGGIGQASNGYVFSDGSSFTLAASYFKVDGNTANKRMVVSSTGGEQQYRSVVTSWNTTKPAGGYWIVDDDPKGFGFTPDMAAIFLYMLEQTKSNPRGNVAGELGLPSNFECTY